MDLLDEAKRLLIKEEATCVAYTKKGIYLSKERGIAPILLKLEEDIRFFEGAYVADKVIGRSAALLYIKGGISSLYAEVISEHALRALDSVAIRVDYKEKVPYIINRKGDGICLMEQTVLDIISPEVAYELLIRKVKALGNLINKDQ